MECTKFRYAPIQRFILHQKKLALKTIIDINQNLFSNVLILRQMSLDNICNLTHVKTIKFINEQSNCIIQFSIVTGVMDFLNESIRPHKINIQILILICKKYGAGGQILIIIFYFFYNHLPHRSCSRNNNSFILLNC